MTDLDFYAQFRALPDDIKKQVMDFIIALKIKKSTDPSQRKPRKFGYLKGKIKIAPDFDAPLDDFKDYM